MHRPIAVILLLATTPLLADPDHQRVISRSVNGDTIERDVTVDFPHGGRSLVTFTLVTRPDGSFTYDPALQRPDTLESAARYCEEATAGSKPLAPGQGYSIWSEGAQFGLSCHSDGVIDIPVGGTFSDGVSDTRKFSEIAFAPFLWALAPKNYPVWAAENRDHYGYYQYRSDQGMMFAAELNVASVCHSLDRRFIPGNSFGSGNLFVKCYVPSPGRIATTMTACGGPQCAVDRGFLDVLPKP